MTDLVSSIAYLLLGGVIGYVLSQLQIRAEHAEREAHAALTGERVVKAPEEFEGPRRSRRLRGWAWLRSEAPVLVALCIAGYGIVTSQHASDEVAAQAVANDDQGRCVQSLFVKYVVGAQEVRDARRAYDAADSENDDALARLFALVGNPDATRADQRAAFEASQRALDAKRDARRALDKAIVNNPLPTADDIKAC